MFSCDTENVRKNYMFEHDGFEIVEDFITMEQLAPVYADISGSDFPLVKGGIRNVEKKFLSIAKLVCSDHIVGKATQYLPREAKFVRALLFDKTLENNWLVTWHQDKTVSVSDRFDNEEWGPWSVKDDVQHVQPSNEVLNQMVTVRIHLDASTVENGCLNVLPGSHLNGILSQAEVVRQANQPDDVINCAASAGSALIMRPLLLHSSSKAREPSKRRVLHLEFCSYTLPNGIFWA